MGSFACHTFISSVVPKLRQTKITIAMNTTVTQYPHGTSMCMSCKQTSNVLRCKCTGNEKHNSLFCSVHREFYKHTSFYTKHKTCCIMSQEIVPLRTVSDVAKFQTQYPVSSLKFVNKHGVSTRCIHHWIIDRYRR